MAFADSLIGSLSKNKYGRALVGALQETGDDLTGGWTSDIRAKKFGKAVGLDKAEVEKRAKARANEFIPIAALQNKERDLLAADRKQEMSRLQSLPVQDVQTGPGTNLLKSGGVKQVATPLPGELPPPVTAIGLARELSNREVVQELMTRVPDRKGSIGRSVQRGAIRGLSFGTMGQRDYDDPAIQAQLAKNPLTTGEKVAETASEIGASFVPYSAVANVVGKSLRTVHAIDRIARTHPFLFGATIQNLGEELVDMSIRKGTGQEYDERQFIMGMALGGAFEGVWAGARGLQNVNPATVQSQLNGLASGLKNASPKDLYEAAKDVRIEGTDMTYGSLFKEHRLAFFQGKDGRPGIDRPAEPPKIDPDDVPLSQLDSSTGKAGGEADYATGKSLAEYEADRAIDQGTMLPRDIGENRMPGLRGDERLGSFNERNAREELESIAKTFEDMSEPSKNYRGGELYARAIRELDARGAFAFTNKDVASLDMPSTSKLLQEAADHHAGQPIELRIREVLDSRSKGTYDVQDGTDEALVEFERGFSEAIQGVKDSSSVSSRVRKLIDDGFINPQEVIDEKGTKLVDLLEQYESTISSRTAKAQATRRETKLPENSRVPQKTIAKAPRRAKLEKPKTDAEVEELLFEPTLRSHFADFFNKSLNSRYIERFGTEGKEISKMIDTADEIAGVRIGIDVSEMQPILKRMTPEELERFPDIAEGRLQASSENEKAMMAFWAGRRAHIANSAQAHGITVRGADGVDRPFMPRDNYYPRRLNEDELKKIRSNPDKQNKLFEDMVQKSNGRIASITEAKKIFNDIIRDRLQKRFGNLEKAREIDFLPDYMLIRDPRLVLSSYLEGSRRRLADAAQFGPKQERILELIERARTKGMDADTMLALVRRATGEEIFNPGEVALSRAARLYQNITKLSLAAVTNLGDVVKPFVRTGEFIPTLRGIVRSFTDSGQIQATRSGAVEANLRALLQDAGDSRASDLFFKYTGFTATETKIRQFNANAGIAHAEVLVKRLKANPDNAFAYRRLAQWMEDPDAAIKRGYLTQAEKDVIGFRGIADTQPVRRMDLPFYWQRPGVKVVTQFKTFAYKHMTFLKKFMVDEAARGNIRPLLAFLVLGQVVGESVGDLKAFVRGREREQEMGRRIIDNYMTIGGIGLATDFLANLQYSSLGGGFLKFVAGPTLTDIDDWLTRATSSNRVERLTKKGVSTLPIVGPYSAQKLFPTSKTYKARTIPIAEDIIQLMEGAKKGHTTRQPPSRSTSRKPPSR
jgi:hypothetical protein